jgi:hypothetical protein
LVWVRPGETPVAEVRARLARGSVGLKLHPVVDEFPVTPLTSILLEVADGSPSWPVPGRLLPLWNQPLIAY